MKNQFGIVMSYVFQHGRNDIIQLFKRHNLPFEPTPQDVVRGIKVRGILFLHDFDVNILRPYAKKYLSEIGQSSFSNNNGDESGAAQSLSSSAKNPNRGANILAGLSAAFNIGNTIMGTVSTIKNSNNPTNQQAPTPYVPSVSDDPGTSAKAKDTDKTKTYLIIGGALSVLIVVAFLIMNKK
ncbi:MAG: hypothetical protein LC105_05430 [Chitinophagales bacterium]|nr:hypothetical protein [Chitinophagales bacterium]MCZ2393276.1 hypothetical protein [Chitinophagales bacterium]